MSFTIVTDSCANLPESMVEERNLVVIPLSFYVGDKEMKSYQKGSVTDIKQFYDMMRNKEDITTSQVNPEDFKAIFTPMLEDEQDILYLAFSSGLSGTYQSSVIAIDELKEQFPQRTIVTVDTLCASIGQGLMVLYAADMRDAGKSLEETAAWVEANRLNLVHWFTVDDLFFLNRGGRVSTTSAVFGSILQIKPVMHMDNDGKLAVVSKARGRKQALQTLVANMEKNVVNPEEQRVAIVHGDCLEEAEYVKTLIENKFSIKEIFIHYLDPVIGAHSGPGTLAVFYLGTDRD
ncbi:MAG: DegV family protein [Ruminococcaceae bacterium]|nr:DegV family protein [Oscillospiraceae bacterium]